MIWGDYVRVGIGYDVHKLEEGYNLVIGGVKIAHPKGLVGHSDADVLVHAIMDAVLGAAALGDIGKHFPDSDATYKGISSIKLLEDVAGILDENGYKIGNIDSVVIAQAPKLAMHITDMRKAISRALDIDIDRISVKATTTEMLGFEGREEGVAAQAVALVTKK